MVEIITSGTVLGVATLLITAYAARKRDLETITDRQQKVDARLTGKTVQSDYWGIEYVHIELTERSGGVYWVVKMLTGRISGEAEVTVRYHGPSVPGDVWEGKRGQAMLNGFPYPVEHLVTDETTHPTVAVFRIRSVDPDTIKNFSKTLLTLDAENRE
jgi:hypothetical protein